MLGLVRLTLTPEQAAVVYAALRYYEDTFLDLENPDDEQAAESALWTFTASRVRWRLHRMMRRRGIVMESES